MIFKIYITNSNLHKMVLPKKVVVSKMTPVSWGLYLEASMRPNVNTVASWTSDRSTGYIGWYAQKEKPL